MAGGENSPEHLSKRQVLHSEWRKRAQSAEFCDASAVAVALEIEETAARRLPEVSGSEGRCDYAAASDSPTDDCFHGAKTRDHSRGPVAESFPVHP